MEPVSIGISVSALAISAASFFLTWRRGRPRVRIRAHYEWFEERGGPHGEYLTVVVWNDGPSTETVLDVGLQGTRRTKFSAIMGGTPFDLAPGQSKTIMHDVDNLAEDLHFAGVESANRAYVFTGRQKTIESRIGPSGPRRTMLRLLSIPRRIRRKWQFRNAVTLELP